MFLSTKIRRYHLDKKFFILLFSYLVPKKNFVYAIFSKFIKIITLIYLNILIRAILHFLINIFPFIDLSG